MGGITHPLVFEVNTRCWLRELSAARGRPIHLGTVPDEEFERWRRLGFTHVWLMGVWTTGPCSREVFLRHATTPDRLRTLLGPWSSADVPGSPYAIARYEVPESLGGEDALRAFRERLHRHGLGLLLDFVPNHVGLDHPWLEEHPEFFVQAARETEGTFLQATRHGRCWIAHGRDPNFFPWADTAQLDLRLPAVRSALVEELRPVAARCDGVRCDAAMLVLNEVFARTWSRFPGVTPTPAGEFWSETIAAVRRPGFIFVAEAYWDLEARLQSLGFDFTYDKRVTDFLVDRRPHELQRHLLDKGDAFVARCAHFLENHDEPRVASRLSLEEHRAAALLILSLPGLRLLHEGQLEGARLHTPVQLSRRPVEPTDAAIVALYEDLLGRLRETSVGRGHARLLEPLPASRDDDTHRNVIAIQWMSHRDSFDLAVINLSAQEAACRVPLRIENVVGSAWEFRNLLSNEHLVFPVRLLPAPSLELNLRPHAAHLFLVRPHLLA